MTPSERDEPEAGGDEPASAGSDQVAVRLPDRVRARVLTLAAEALGRMPPEQLPPALRRVASFTPARRAKLAGGPILGALESDDAFRAHLATQVRAQVADVATLLEEGTSSQAADPIDLAAVAYLLRPSGWADVVAEVAGAEDSAAVATASRQMSEQLDRLRRQLEETTAEMREVRERSRRQSAALKAENAELRRKLGDARNRTRAAESAASEAERVVADTTASAAAASTAGEAENRRLRARIEELERASSETRRAGRAEKVSATVRARLLLDTILEAAQGLRRELALPATQGAPADAVEADVAEQGRRTPTSHGSMASDDPALLEELLDLPRAHMVVDGYNVTKDAWPELPLERQRDRLLAGLGPLVARCGAEVTVVFDAADKAERPPVTSPRGVRVLFSPFGVIADDVIRELVTVEPTGRPVVVVSNDGEVVRDVVRQGARVVASAALTRLVSRA